MKSIQILSVAAIVTTLFFSACSNDDNIVPEENIPTTTDSVTTENVTYEANGSFIYTDAATSTPKTYSHQFVKIQYKNVSHVWENTNYTYLTFYNTNSTAAAEMITFVFLGKEFPKTGTYKIGPQTVAVNGISEADKLLPNEVAILAVGNGNVTKRDATKTINIENNKGKITITSSNEINIYDNIMGELKGTCKNINLTRTIKKL